MQRRAMQQFLVLVYLFSLIYLWFNIIVIPRNGRYSGVRNTNPFSMPKIIYFIKRRKLFYIKVIHFYDLFNSYFTYNLLYKKTGGHKVPTRQTNVLDWKF